MKDARPVTTVERAPAPASDKSHTGRRGWPRARPTRDAAEMRSQASRGSARESPPRAEATAEPTTQSSRVRLRQTRAAADPNRSRSTLRLSGAAVSRDVDQTLFGKV